MDVDIYITAKSGKKEIRVPWLPETIECESGGATFAKYDIINKGEVAIPTGTELSHISWESVFPGKKRSDDSMLRGSWKDPKTYHNLLEDWKKKGTKVRVMVTGYPINKDMYVETYTAVPAGGFGDLEYTVSFVEKRSVSVSTSKVATPAKAPTRPETKSNEGTYTVKKGDTLWAIAQKYYNSGLAYTKIYNANKSIIESTAKKHGFSSSDGGHWIFPGTKLTIPK